MKKEEFVVKLRLNGIEISPKQLQLFDKYYRLLLDYNKRVNLTSIVAEEEVYGKHFYDSLLVLLDKERLGNTCDVGSGAGFPGLPLLIVAEDMDLSIVEPNGKKLEFLKLLIKELELDRVKLFRERAEEHVRNYREHYDVVLSRAVAKLNILSELCLPLCQPGGEFIALKGKEGLQELAAAEGALSTLGGEVITVNKHHYDEQTRFNIRMIKLRKTPDIYPRNYGSIIKRPL